MPYEIDQSWKIERTNKDSYFAIANGKSLCLKLSAKNKRELIYYLNNYFGKTHKNILRIFAAVIVLLIKESHMEDRQLIIVDKEYPTYEPFIKGLITDYQKKINISTVYEIDFRLIGKKSPAHILCNSAFRKNLSYSAINLKILMSIIGNKKLIKRVSELRSVG